MNCKRGELAVLVRAVLPENVGRIVECLDCLVIAERGPVWRVRSCGSPMRSVNNLTGVIVDRIGLSPDAWLRPITPPATDITQREPAEQSA